MAKYYVQSGTLRTVVEAASSRRAAMWAVHQAMQQILPIDDAHRSCSPESKSQSALDRPIAVLADTVCVSQNGYSSSTRVTLPTMDVVNQWHEMCETLSRLERLVGQSVAA